MENKAEQLKAFFSDEEKIKVLTNDEEFIEKVSDGKATPEIYREELEKFGIEISADEAKQIKDTVNKIFETPAEKLNDDFLDSIAGGKKNDNYDNNYYNNNNEIVSRAEQPQSGKFTTGDKVLLGAGIGAGLVIADVLVGTSFMLAGCIYKDVAEDAEKYNKWGKRSKYMQKADKCLEIGAHMLVIPAAVGTNKLLMHI